MKFFCPRQNVEHEEHESTGRGTPTTMFAKGKGPASSRAANALPSVVGPTGSRAFPSPNQFFRSLSISSPKRSTPTKTLPRNLRQAAKWALITMVLSILSLATDSPPNERTFPKSKTEIEKVVRTLQGSTSGRLPTLEGFAQPGERPLERFQKGFYQCSIQIMPLASGKSKVRVLAKITAWYVDPNASHSGYQTLPSNGRLENDLLDQIAEALGSAGSQESIATKSTPQSPEPAISAPMPQIPRGAVHGTAQGSRADASGSLKSQTDAAEKHEQELSAEAKGLEEILQNQSHPNNLAAVKTTGTPVLQNPNADAKILFSATAGDEFEILDVNPNWIHVRISGLSRGWIRRSSLEMPESSAKSAKSLDAAEEFKVSNEQIAPFPGDWEPLRGKIVKIVTVQKAEGASNQGAQARLKFAKALFIKQYSQFSATDVPSGIVIIFDADDGGMIAATSSTLKNWNAATEPDDAIWKECFFDPPELSKN